MHIVSAYQARRNFSELIERAFYQNERIQIERNKKRMAWLVGDPFMAAVEKLLAESPGLMETLAIMLDDEMMAAIRQGDREVREGKTIPIAKALDD